MAAPTTLLTGKTAIVTGGTRGIGGGISREFIARGANVAMVYVNPAKKAAAEKFATELSSLGGDNSAVAICADLAEADGPATIVKKTLEKFGGNRIDIIVNNAALYNDTPTPDLTTDIYENIMNADLRGPIFLVQAALPYMPRGGRIINMSSFATRHIPIGPGTPPMPLYLAAKSALESLARTWAVEFGHSRGITANAVSVGLVETDMIAYLPEEVKEIIRANNAKVTGAAPRTGTPDDIAQIVAFLASEGSRWAWIDALDDEPRAVRYQMLYHVDCLENISGLNLEAPNTPERFALAKI